MKALTKFPEVAKEDVQAATLRALNHADIIDTIIQCVPPHELRKVGHINRDFFHATHSPPVWIKQYAPATIDWPSRSVLTYLKPRAPGIEPDPYEIKYVDKDTTRTLGHFSHEQWYLKYTKPSSKEFSVSIQQILDEVTGLGLHGIFMIGPEQTPQQAYEEHLLRKRPDTYAFLKDRAYRLDHGLPVPIYSLGAKVFMRLGLIWGASLGGLIVCSDYFNEAKTIAAKSTFFAGSAVSAAGLVISTMGFALGVSFGGQGALRNMFLGPLESYRINQWARQVVEIERSEQKSRIKVE